MGISSSRAHRVVLTQLVLVLVFSALALAGLCPAAGAATRLSVDISQTGESIAGYEFTPGSAVAVHVFDSPGGTELFDTMVITGAGGEFIIHRFVHGLDLAPGMYVMAVDGASSLTRELELAAITFDPLHFDTDSATGTAPADASVAVHISGPGVPGLANLTVTADDVTGAWTADFGTIPFDIVFGMWGNASVADADGDTTEAGSAPYPSITATVRMGIWGNNFTPNASVTVRVSEGEETLFSGSAPTDAGGNFGVDGQTLGFWIEQPMVVEVSDGTYTKQLALADLTFGPFDFENDRATGTAPPGAEVMVTVSEPGSPGGVGQTVTADGTTGVWTADYAGLFDIVYGTGGWAQVGDGDGDWTQHSSLPAPNITAQLGGGIWGSWFSDDGSLSVTVTVTEGEVTRYSETMPAPYGSFNIGPEALGFALAPGMVVSVDDGTYTKELTLADLTFGPFDVDADLATGTAPPGAEVMVSVSNQGAGGWADLTVTADGTTGAWAADFSGQFDVVTSTYGTAQVVDDDGDLTRVDTSPYPMVMADLGAGLWGDGFAPDSTMSVIVSQDGAELYSWGEVPTDGNGHFDLSPDYLSFVIAPGMTIAASDGTYSKYLVVEDLGVDPLDVAGDTVTGTAPTGASVHISVWNQDSGHELDVEADLTTGIWSADFGAAGFDILAGMECDVLLHDEDGDATRATPPRMPYVWGYLNDGITGGDFAPGATVTVEVYDGDTPLYSDAVTTDLYGNFELWWDQLQVDLVPGMRITADDGAHAKELTLVALTMDLIDAGTDTARGTGPAGETVVADVYADPEGSSLMVQVDANGDWSVDFSPFDVTPGMDGAVRYEDEDGDATKATWYPPTISATYTREWGDRIEGGAFTPDSTVDVLLYESWEPGASLLWSESVPTDGGGSFQLWLGTERELASGMHLVVTDPVTALSKSLMLVELWVEHLDPDGDVAWGDAPAGFNVVLGLSSETGEWLGEWTGTANESGIFTIDFNVAEPGPVDVTWGSSAEVWIADDDGDATRAEVCTPTIVGDPARDLVTGRGFPRNEGVNVEIRSSSGDLVWSTLVASNGNGYLDALSAFQGLNLTAGMVVCVSCSLTGVAKELVIAPISFDDLDPVTDTASGTGPWGHTLTVGGHGVEWAAEIGQVSPDVTGHWVLDIGAGGGEVEMDMTASVSLSDAEADLTVVPFAPHLDALSSSSHPDADAWYASGDAALAWVPSPSTSGYSWVLDQDPATVPDETVEGMETGAAFSGLGDGVWYFHVRAQGGPAIYEDGPLLWGATSHRAVRVDTAAPTTSDNVPAGVQSKPVTVTLSGNDATSGVAEIRYQLDGGDWTVYEAPLEIATSGAHTLAYYGVDRAGNEETPHHEKTVEVSIIPSLTVLSPVGWESWQSGTTQTLGWTISSAVDGGQFVAYLVNAADPSRWHFAGFTDVVPGETVYTPSFSTLGIPAGTYSAFVFYRADSSAWMWHAWDQSPGTVTITPATLAITVDTPAGGESWPSGSSQTLGWTLNTPVDTGQFGVWLINTETGSWYDAGYYAAVPGQVVYAPTFSTMGVPAGDYSAAVYYRTDPDVWAWETVATSPGSATITPAAFAITTTVPSGVESWPAGTIQTLGWTVSSAVDVGQFGVWLIDQATGSWYGVGYFDAIAGMTDYSPSFSTLGIPEGSYSAVVYYRSDPDVWTWQASDESPGAVTITAAAVTITVDIPAGGEEWVVGSAQSLGWTLLSAVDGGQFGVWLVNETTGAWYEAGYYDAVPVQTVYAPSFVVPVVPAGTYKAIIYYRVDPTQWVWAANALSQGAVTVRP